MSGAVRLLGAGVSGGLWFFLIFQHALEHCKMIKWYSHIITSRSFFDTVHSSTLIQFTKENGMTPVEPHLNWKPLPTDLDAWS